MTTAKSLALTGALLLSAAGGIQRAIATDCWYDRSKGHYSNCYDGSESCGQYQYCIHASCYANGSEVVAGCFPQGGVQCYWGGCAAAYLFADCYAC
jgi:hypothetical protein